MEFVMRHSIGIRLAVAVTAMTAFLLLVLAGAHYLDEGLESGSTAFASMKSSTPSSLVPLLSTPIRKLVGDAVFLNDVQLKKGPKPGIFFAEGVHGRQMLVLSDDKKSSGTFGKVDIKGQIRRLPEAQMLRKEWHLTARQVKSLQNQNLYISAEYIER